MKDSISALASLRVLILGKASFHVMETLKKICGKALVGRN
jgi:hypothetical protein